MNLHEYQAKQLLAQHGVEVPGGEPCTTADEARSIAEKLFADGHEMVVMKIQIHSGGRGKGVFKDGFKGGVHLCKTAGEVHEKASAMLGNTIVTKQTGEAGRKVHTLLVASAEKIVSEFYLAVLLDRETSQPLIMVSREGGVDIEEVAETNPEKILSLGIDPATGLQPHHIRRIAGVLGLSKDTAKQLPGFLGGLYRAFNELDASLLEINPLVVTGSGDLLALDAKMSFDDNALYRHPDVLALRDLAEEDPAEVRASEFELNYIKLDGNIGCMVNGAGLAMATMDIIQLQGGSPANFLDVGGSATAERVTEAFKIILSDENVKGILVNIFGGIMRCDIIAEGVVSAARSLGLDKPLVVRLEGTNVEEGKRIMAESGLDIIAADNLADAAAKIVAATA